MKKFKIYTATGNEFIVNGILAIPDDVTGQTVVYSNEDPAIEHIVAVIPASALIIVETQN